MLHDLLSSLTPEQVDFLQTKVAELKTIKDKERFKSTLTQTARTLKIPELVCLLMLEELNLFSVNVNYAYTLEQRATLLNKMAQYRTLNNSNILFGAFYADNPAFTSTLIGVFSMLRLGRAAGLEKDAEGRGLVAHCILSGKRDLLPRVEAFLGREEYKNQLDALSEEQTIALFKNGSGALRADLIDRIRAMNINGFRVDQVLSEQGINYYLGLDTPFPPSLESIRFNRTQEFFTSEAHRLVTQNLIQTTAESEDDLDYARTLHNVFRVLDINLLQWVLQSNEFQQVAAYDNNSLIKMAINSYGGSMTEIALALLQTSGVISTAGDNNNELLKLAINRRNVALVRALLDIPAVRNNIDVSLVEEINGEEINGLLIPHVKWYGQPLNLIVTPEVYELVTTGLMFDTEQMRYAMRDLNSFIRHFRDQNPFTNTNLKIMRLFDAHEQVKRMNAAADSRESSMGQRAQQAAEVGYQSAQALYGEAFRNHPNGLVGIEARIREMILDEILSDPIETPLTPAERQFIETNRAAILQGNNRNLMDQVRAQFGSNTNPSHIAWRAYDQFAPVIMWDNLLTSNDLQYRTRVAHYFLGLVDPVYQAKSDMTFEDRRGVFIGTIAEIRRAHNEHNPEQGVDNPSCGPGTIGRIQKMGAGHEMLQMIDPVELLPEIITRILSERLAVRLENETDEVKAKFALALVFLNEIHIRDIVRNNDLAIQDVLDNEIPVSELMTIHDQIIDMLGIDSGAHYPFHNILLQEINNDLRQRNQPRVRPLTNEELTFVRLQVYDLCFNQVGEKISNRISQELKPDMDIVDPKDPYELERHRDMLTKLREKPAASNKQLQAHHQQQIRVKENMISKGEQKTAYFNTVFERLRGDSQLESLPLDVIAYLAKNMVESAYDSDDFDADKPRFALEHLKAAYESLREFKQFQIIPFLEEDASARSEVIAEIDDKGKGKEEEITPKSIVHGFNHLRLSSSSSHANVAESSSSASMRLA